MTRLVLLGAGLGVFLAALIAFLPARLVSDAALRPVGIEADLVTGPVWNGRLYRVNVTGQRFAEGRLALAFWPLLTGSARLDIALEDESASARGTLTARPGRLALTGWALAAEARRVPGVNALPVPQPVRVYGEIDALIFENGACMAAAGTLTTPLLARLGQRYQLELPQVEATLGCAGEAVALSYEGISPVLSMTGSARLDASGYRWTSQASSGEPGVIAVLIALGFEETGAAWRAEGEGRYR